jgi:hypothetical protein
MSVEGTWQLVIATPIGRQDVVLELSTADGTLRGVARGRAEEVDLTDLALDGDQLTWRQSITRPMRLNLVFEMTVRGDEMTGRSKAGRLPASTVTGRRAPAP